MSAITMFSIFITPKRKLQMEAFFNDLGLTLECGIRIFLEHCIMMPELPVKTVVFQEGTEADTVLLSIPMDTYKLSQINGIFEKHGITAETAVNSYFEACLTEWGIPFRIGYPKPNANTLAAMQEAEDMVSGRIQIVEYYTVEELMDAWESGDFEGDMNMPTQYGSSEVYQVAKRLETELIEIEEV